MKNSEFEYVNFTFIRGGLAEIGKDTSNVIWCAYNKVNAENKIYLPTHGSAELFINGTHYTMEKGKVYFIGENEIRSYYQSDNKSYFSKRLLHFFADCRAENVKDAFDLPDEIKLNKDEYEKMYELMSQISIYDGAAMADLSETFINKSKTFNIVSYYIYLARKKNLHRIYDRGVQAKINLMLMQYIKDNIDTKDMAKKISMNEKYFSRYFKNIFRTSPKKLVNKQQYQNAVGQILYTNSSIAEISKKCGFKHESYFCENFKKIYGVNPLKLRETITKADNIKNV